MKNSFETMSIISWPKFTWLVFYSNHPPKCNPSNHRYTLGTFWKFRHWSNSMVPTWSNMFYQDLGYWDQYEPPSDHSFSGVYNPYNMVICTFKIWKHPKWVSICPCWWPSLLSFMSIRTEVGIFSPPSPCWQLWVCLSIWAYLKMDYP